MLPQAKPANAGFNDRTPQGVIYRTGAVGLLVVAALLLIAVPAHASHGGATASSIQPSVSVPGGTVTIDIEPGEDPYVATDILLPAPTVDGRQLTFDVQATNATYGAGAWTVDEAASSDEEIRFRWRTANNTLESADDPTAASPSPPAELEVVLNGTQPITEGNATWNVRFCNGDWFNTTGTSLYLCLDDHVEPAVNTFDNKAPEIEVTLSDAEGHATSPFYEEVVINVTATDNGSGVNAVAIDNVANLSGSNISDTRSLPGTHTVPYAAQDKVGNLNESVLEPTVVGGIAAAPAKPGPFVAGETVKVLAGYAADGDSSTPTWVTTADGNVSLSLVDGPATADLDPTGPLSDGVRIFDFTATKIGTYTLNATGTHVPVPGSVDLTVEPATLDAISITPSSATVVTGGVVDFNASGQDAYGNPVDFPPSWTTDCGRVSPSGEFVAPSEPGTCTVRAEHHNGDSLVADEVDVTVQSPEDVEDGDGDDGPTVLSVSNLRSPSHDVDAWSTEEGIEMAWDAPDGDVAGYAFTLTKDDGDVGTDPATTKTSISVKAGSDGTYTFKVRPVASDGTPGEVASFGPIKVDTEGPLPPYDAEPEIVDDGLELSWSELTASEGSPIAAYTVDRMADGGSWSRLAEIVDGTSFVDDEIPAPGTYHYRFRSLDEAGNLGPPSKRVTVQLDEIPGSSSAEGIPASVADLYEALGIEPRNATFEDVDGDGVADEITGDVRLSIARTTSIDGATAYLVSAEGRDTGALMTATSKAYRVTQAQADIGSEKVGKNGLVVTAEAGSTDGWTLVQIPDDHPDLDLKGVFDGQRDRLSEDRYWRLDGTVAVLDDGGGTYMLMYAEPSGSGGPSGGRPAATPGPGALVALAGFVAAAAWVARSRDP